MDKSDDSDVAVVGFDFSGDDMLRGELLTFEQGLTVLYGLNGAGKSRLLRGLRGALLGIQTDVSVSLVTKAVVTPALEKLLSRSLQDVVGARPLALALAQELAEPKDFTSSPGQRSSERLLELGSVEAVIASHIETMMGYRYPQLLDEVLEDRLFLLAPSGTEESPSWAAHPVMDPKRPGASQAQSEYSNLYAKFEANDSDDEDAAYDTFVEDMSEMPLLEDGGHFWVPGRRAAVSPSSVLLYNWSTFTMDFAAPITVAGNVDLGLDVVDLERDAVVGTQQYIAELVAGALETNLDDESLDDRAETFHRVEPSRIPHRIRWLSEEDMQRMDAFVERTIREACRQLSEGVTTALSEVLLEPLVAELELTPIALRHAGPSHAWKFSRPDQSHVRVGLSDLSKAEHSWAVRSINEVIYWHTREHDASLGGSLRPVVYLLDEPEAALHRAAEAYMARSLVRRARDPRRALIVATHSPELLDATEARLIGLRRTGTALSPSVLELDLSDRTLIDQLGLTPSDLLRWPRVILLVEGLHDEVLLDHYLGDRLRAARVDVLVLRGGTKLPLTVDSKVLFAHTEAHVVGLVDNENAANLRETWAKAQEAAVRGETQIAIEIVLAGIPKDRAESDFLRNWLTGALERGLDGRVTPYALSAADVIEYLPVDAFVEGAESWEALKSEHKMARSESPAKTAREFKPWLRARYGVEFTDETLRAVASRTAIPAEFEMLMNTLDALSLRQD